MRRGISKSVAPLERPEFHGGGGFNVLTGVPSLVAWYDADAAAASFFNATTGGTLVTTTGTQVARWNDLSGNANHLIQATTAQQMSLITSQINGRNVLRSTGVPFNMQCLAVTPHTVAVGTLIVAYQRRSTGQSFSRLFETGSNNGQAIVTDTGDQYLWYQMGSNANAANGSGETNITLNPHIAMNRNQGVGISCNGYFDGNHDGSVVAANNTLNLPFTLGAYAGQLTGPYNASADYCEIILSNAVLAFTVVNQCFAYLSAKWGIPVVTAS